MSSSYGTLALETDDNGIATLILNRPEKLNALNDLMLDELAEAFGQIQSDSSVYGVIITGAGQKAFAAGADIEELRKLDKRGGRKQSQKGQQIFQSVEDTRKPVIALINGYALGGGAELALACHLRIATPDAEFGLPEVGLGLIPGYGGTQRLANIIGRTRALEMILTGSRITSDVALNYGLVNAVFGSDEALEKTRRFAGSILDNGPIAVRSAIEAVYRSGDENGYQVEADLFGDLFGTKDFKEGTAAFLEKRKPEFKGE